MEVKPSILVIILYVYIVYIKLTDPQSPFLDRRKNHKRLFRKASTGLCEYQAPGCSTEKEKKKLGNR